MSWIGVYVVATSCACPQSTCLRTGGGFKLAVRESPPQDRKGTMD